MDIAALKPHHLIEFIKSTWGIHPKKMAALIEGSARCFIIENESGRFFFKVYQDEFNEDTLRNEIYICDFLSKKGFSVSTFLKTNAGTFIERFCQHWCTLQNYIDGFTFQKFEVPRPLLLDSIRVLANIHIALAEFPLQLPTGFEQAWFLQWSKDSAIEKYHHLLALLESSDENYRKISIDFETKSNLIRAFDPTIYDFSSLTIENSHGDYNVLQLIFSSDKVKAVVDFSSCAKLPICWEIIRSYTLSSPECKEAIIDTDNFVHYVKEYLQIKKIEKTDLELMPYFYLFTLIRSSFGYKSYIEKRKNGTPIDRKDQNALAFAAWRTAMCKWLFKHADFLSSRLKKII